MVESDFSVRGLASFGDVAAEEDSVLDYFLTTDAAKDIEQGKAFLVLGRKGAGKTALVRHFSEGGHPMPSRALGLRGYPWKVHERCRDQGAADLEAYAASWRYLIAVELASLVLPLVSGGSKPAKALTSFLTDNYGGVNPPLEKILRPSRLRLSSVSLDPAVLGNKLGGVSLDRAKGDLGLGAELDAVSDAILE